MGVTKMGFEGIAYYGVAGSTAATAITDSADISETFEVEKGNTTVRGNSSSPPIETEDVTVRKYSVEITMLNRSTDTVLEALRVAAAAGTPVALRMKDYAAGKGFDGDVTLSMTHGKPLRGEQTIQFTATPTRQSGRDPQLYV